MAAITNHRTGAGYLGVSLEILRKEPQDGFISRNCVGMNSEMGLMWTEVSFWVAEQMMFQGEVLLHSSSIRDFTRSLEKAIAVKPTGKRKRVIKKIDFGICSPELTIKVEQATYRSDPDDDPDYNPEKPTFTFYNLIFVVDTGIAAGESGVSGEGPAMYFEPNEEDLLAFARDWRAEMEMALLLEKQDHESDEPWIFC